MLAHVQCYFEGQTLWFPRFSDLIDLRPRESWMSRRTIWISWFAKRRSDSSSETNLKRLKGSVHSHSVLTGPILNNGWLAMIWKSKQFTTLKKEDIGGSSKINLAPKNSATAGRCSQLARGAGSCQDRFFWMIWWFVVPGPTNISTTVGSRTKRSKRWVVGISSSNLSKSWPVVPCCSVCFRRLWIIHRSSWSWAAARAQLLSEAQEADHAAKVPSAASLAMRPQPGLGGFPNQNSSNQDRDDGALIKLVKNWLVHQQLGAYQNQLDVCCCVPWLVSRF